MHCLQVFHFMLNHIAAHFIAIDITFNGVTIFNIFLLSWNLKNVCLMSSSSHFIYQHRNNSPSILFSSTFNESFRERLITLKWLHTAKIIISMSHEWYSSVQAFEPCHLIIMIALNNRHKYSFCHIEHSIFNINKSLEYCSEINFSFYFTYFIQYMNRSYF